MTSFLHENFLLPAHNIKLIHPPSTCLAQASLHHPLYNPLVHTTFSNRDHRVNLTCTSERAPLKFLESLTSFELPLQPPSSRLHSSLPHSRPHTPGLPTMVKQYGNVYLIAAISIIGGGLFGFDISSMSAM